MAGKNQRLELTWYNKDKALIPTENGKYGYTWVDPRDPRYCETHTLTITDSVDGAQAPKEEGATYSERADLEPQDDNLLILGESGDVLEALTRVPDLRDKYLGKVKCVYIDVTAPTWIQGIGCLRVDAPRRTWDHEKARPGKYLVGPSTLVLAA